MQSLLFLRPSDDAPISRIINIDRMDHASADPNNPECTLVNVGLTAVTLQMPFSKFLENVEDLLKDNYRINAEWIAKGREFQLHVIKEMINEIKRT
jgi:hypothetical protein